MAESNTTPSIQVQLTLDKAEATYLKSLLQNYLGEGEENQGERKIRENLFQSLPHFRDLS